jgi:hypothetical protein
MATLYPAAQQFSKLSALIGDPAHWRALATTVDAPPGAADDFLGRLRLLYGVPFRYLVPDSRMLPPESIRFFYVDQNWTGALIDGANSLGRITKVDLAHDTALAEVARESADNAALNIRRKQLKRAPSPNPVEDPKYTGFLLRSAVVAGWPGLEVQAFETPQGTGPIDSARMDRLAPDVLICIFPKVFQSLNIHEPKEGVVFGAEPVYASANAEALGADPVSYKKHLRGLGVGGYKVGEFIPDCVVEVPLRDTTSRVVRMSDYKKTIEDKLLGLTPPAWDSARPFTSAQFTLQAVQGASQFIFQTTGALNAASAPRRRAVEARRETDLATLNRFLFPE